MKIREQLRIKEAKKEGIEESKKDIAKNMLELGLEEEIILKVYWII